MDERLNSTFGRVLGQIKLYALMIFFNDIVLSDIKYYLKLLASLFIVPKSVKELIKKQ